MINEIQMSFDTLENLFSKDIWLRFFANLENLLNAKLSHLDTNDPIRKKVASLDEAADYVCSIGEQEGSRWLFGKFTKAKVKVRISISLFKDARSFPNSVYLYFPEKAFDKDEESNLLYDIFVEGNRRFKPFYSFCDSDAMVTRKKKSSGFSVDLQAELIGMFWLTYFNRSYVEFFGQSKFEELPCKKFNLQDGIAIKLGASPLLLDISREEAESFLGKKSFVEPELGFDKPIGKNALTFDNILARVGRVSEA